jgi:hypothetical protein
METPTPAKLTGGNLCGDGRSSVPGSAANADLNASFPGQNCISFRRSHGGAS